MDYVLFVVLFERDLSLSYHDQKQFFWTKRFFKFGKNWNFYTLKLSWPSKGVDGFYMFGKVVCHDKSYNFVQNSISNFSAIYELKSKNMKKFEFFSIWSIFYPQVFSKIACHINTYNFAENSKSKFWNVYRHQRKNVRIGHFQ